MLRFDGELEAEGIRLGTRFTYALSRLAVWLGGRCFEEVEKETYMQKLMEFLGKPSVREKFLQFLESL